MCKCIGLETAKGTFLHTRRLAEDERRIAPTNYRGKGGSNAAFVNESGLYKLILRAHPSRPEVAAFQDWVTRDVLPSIRRSGGYLLNEAARQTADADTRETLPLPSEFLRVSRQFSAPSE